MSIRLPVLMGGLLSLVLIPFLVSSAVLEEIIVTAQKREQIFRMLVLL